MTELTEGRIRGIVREEIDRSFQEAFANAGKSLALELTGDVIGDLINKRLAELEGESVSNVLSKRAVKAIGATVKNCMLEAMAEGRTPEEAAKAVADQFGVEGERVARNAAGKKPTEH